MSVMLYPCIFLCCSVNVSVCLVCCVLDSVCELFGETIRNVFVCGCCFVDVLLLNVMDGFSVGGGALLDIPCMVFHIMLWMGLVWVEVLSWIDRVWSSTVCI